MLADFPFLIFSFPQRRISGVAPRTGRSVSRRLYFRVTPFRVPG